MRETNDRNLYKGELKKCSDKDLNALLSNLLRDKRAINLLGNPTMMKTGEINGVHSNSIQLLLKSRKGIGLDR